MFILDTDHISLFQRNHPTVVARISETPPDELATTVITLEEQVRGRLDRVRKAKNNEEIVRAYKNLLATFLYFQSISVIGFSENAQLIFKNLRKQKVRIGTQDLRIAAIALTHNATIVTRNRQDFISIPLLKIEDWSLENV
ncbi:MAG: type II toxin-antitoxin system VapC family toxin [Desulfobacteraceae bacterium]|nr:type II toxin-antitoxin system VapC family toxin [Desulfobacteraceae bacterium]